MRREIENWKNPVRFPHKMRGGFCYKRANESAGEQRREGRGKSFEDFITTRLPKFW